MRYVIEGTWRGYRSSQDGVYHREVYKTNRKASPFIEALKRLHSLPFGDGTALILSVREAKPREKVQEKHGYRQMIRDAVYAEMERTAPADQTKASGGGRE
jgi:hypothetical protein